MNIIRAAFAPVLTLLICAGPAFAQSNHPVLASAPHPAGQKWLCSNVAGMELGEIPFFLMVLAILAMFVASLFCRVAAVDTQVIVVEDLKYPSNHHVPGVGYYHAPARRWFPLPWNELREGCGYYHGGEWHPEPEAACGLTQPDADHIHEVNQLWRRANPDKMDRLWDDVERRGFGQAMDSLENPYRGS